MVALGLLLLTSVALLAAAPAFIAGHPKQAALAAGKTGGSSAGQPQKGVKSAKGAPAHKVPAAPGLLIMDVDAGADDAMALLLALRQEALTPEGAPGPRLIAVTCTHGNTPLSNVERNVLKTLHLAERLDIPVYSGASESLILTPPGDNFFGEDGFGDFEYENAPDPEKYLQKEHAVNALVRLTKQYPGEITILATGPLSNLALATRMDPEFLNNVKQLMIMGGSSDGSGNIKSGTEFNFFLDPEANFIVFNSTRNESRPIYLLPWDTPAERNLISMDWRLNVLGNTASKYIDFLNKAERKAIESDGELGLWISCDPVTAVLLIRPDLITSSEQHHVDAETAGRYSRGVIYVDYNDQFKPQNTVIIKTFNTEGYQELLLRNLS